MYLTSFFCRKLEHLTKASVMIHVITEAGIKALTYNLTVQPHISGFRFRCFKIQPFLGCL